MRRPGEPEIYFRIIHHADEFSEDSRQIEQPVEVALGPKGAFEKRSLGRLTRLISANRIIDARHPSRRKKKPKTKRKKTAQAKQPKIVELLHKAEEWKRQLDSGAVANQAEIARREGITRARVTHVLALMRLAPEIRKRIFTASREGSQFAVTERSLRPLCSVPDDSKQYEMFLKIENQCASSSRILFE